MQIRKPYNKLALLPLLLVLSAVLSCQNSDKKETQDSPLEKSEVVGELFEGELTYTSEAAVFIGKSFIYGVTKNTLAEELAEQIEAIQTDPNDIVPVTVRGEITPKSEEQEGWDEILTITQIIDVSDTPKRPDIHLK